MPSAAAACAARRAGRRARWCGVIARVRGRRTAWCASRVRGPRVGQPGQAAAPGTEVEQRGGDDGGVDVDAGQVHRPAAGGPVELGAGRRARAPASGSRPSRGRAATRSAGVRGRARSTRSSASPARSAPVRSRPVRARPVAVVCTCASTNAGVTSAPSRSTISSRRRRRRRRRPRRPRRSRRRGRAARSGRRVRITRPR